MPALGLSTWLVFFPTLHQEHLNEVYAEIHPVQSYLHFARVPACRRLPIQVRRVIQLLRKQCHSFFHPKHEPDPLFPFSVFFLAKPYCLPPPCRDSQRAPHI